MDSVGVEAKEIDKGGGGDANQVAEVGPCHPLDLLCEDAWLDVLSFVDDNPRDLLNVGETCSYFGELLENRVPGGRGAGRAACRLEEILPLVIQYAQEEADILALRQVCRRVGETTDKVLECRDQVTPRQNQGFFPWLIPPPPRDAGRYESYEWTQFQKYSMESKERGRWHWPCVQFSSGPTSKPLERFQKYETFLETGHQERRHRPYKMVSKKIRAGCPNRFDNPGPDVPDDKTFLQRLLQFLETSKSEDIRSVYIHSYEATPLQYYHLFCDVVGSVPLLRSLVVIPSTLVTADPGHNSSREEVQELQQFIDGHPLPVAPNLAKLELLCSPPILRHLSIAYGGHLKILHITVIDPSLFWDRGNIKKGTADYQFPLLEYLCIELPPHCLPIILNFRCPLLMSLKVDITPDVEHARAVEPLVELFEAIPSFPTVSNLYLGLYVQLPESTGRESEWEQRNVRKLVVYTCLGSCTAPRLQCYTRVFPNVEEISVLNDESEMEEEFYIEESDDWRRNDLWGDPDLLLLKEGRLRESTIWREARHLQIVNATAYDDMQELVYDYKCYRPQDE